MRVASKNRPGYFWAVDEGVEGYLMREAELFRVTRPSLWGTDGSVSFESVTRPGNYVAHRDGEIFVLSQASYGGSDEEFRRECSWFIREDEFFNGFTSFESIVTPGRYIRHKNRKLKSTTIRSSKDRSDASFMMTDINSGESGRVEEAWKGYLGKTVTIESKAEPSYFWSNEKGPTTRLSTKGDVYRMVQGLAGPGFVSFESTTSPGHFLRKKHGAITMESRQYNELYNRDCSFMPQEDVFFDGYVSFEASDRQSEWIRSQRNKGLELGVTQIGTFRDNNEASFLLNEADEVQRTTTKRPATTPRAPVHPLEPCKLGLRVIKVAQCMKVFVGHW